MNHVRKGHPAEQEGLGLLKPLQVPQTRNHLRTPLTFVFNGISVADACLVVP